MNYNDNLKKTEILKYDLRNESIAAAVAGMFPTDYLDKRCIIFTIHIENEEAHFLMCQILFRKVEEMMLRKGIRKRSASYSGLASFIDVNGSKFSGSNRDFSQVHCHGCIFLPHGLTDREIDILAKNLTLTLRHSTLNVGLAKSSPDAIKFYRFDRYSKDASIKDWVEYAQKEATRIETEGNFGVHLPFDIRESFGLNVKEKIERKQKMVLDLLKGPESFNIFRKPKAQ